MPSRRWRREGTEVRGLDLSELALHGALVGSLARQAARLAARAGSAPLAAGRIRAAPASAWTGSDRPSVRRMYSASFPWSAERTAAILPSISVFSSSGYLPSRSRIVFSAW